MGFAEATRRLADQTEEAHRRLSKTWCRAPITQGSRHSPGHGLVLNYIITIPGAPLAAPHDPVDRCGGIPRRDASRSEPIPPGVDCGSRRAPPRSRTRPQPGRTKDRRIHKVLLEFRLVARPDSCIIHWVTA